MKTKREGAAKVTHGRGETNKRQQEECKMKEVTMISCEGEKVYGKN